jgi:hypothetical protein
MVEQPGSEAAPPFLVLTIGIDGEISKTASRAGVDQVFEVLLGFFYSLYMF